MFLATFFQGLVFKWGSLVGISLPSSGANGSLPFVATDVVFRPKEFTSAITSDWATVPWCTSDFAPYGDKTIDHLSSINDPVAGIGDICRYMGVVEDAHWRMPTAAEWAELYGSTETNKGQSFRLGDGWIEGNYYPLSGRAFGPGQNGVKITESGAEARVINADPYDDSAVFLSASGNRNYANSAIWNLGAYGYYWSSTTSTIDRGYDIQFDSTSVWPQYSNIRTHAFHIRCIRE